MTTSDFLELNLDSRCGMRRPERLIPLLALVLTCCTSAREIETAPPRPFQPAPPVEEPAASQARLSVLFREGMTELPADVEQLRFRVAEIHLRQADGDWLRFPSDLHLVELQRGRNGTERTMLDSRVPSVAYDSLAVVFDRIFAQFGENAGAPLTAGAGTPHRMALEMNPIAGEHTTLVLRFEPGPSLSRTPDCRWYFIPLLRSEVIRTPAPPMP
jgi:hypothetical protein